MPPDLETAVQAPASDDALEAADAAGLTYVSDEEPGYRRRKSGTGFSYLDPSGRRVTDRALLKRIRSLAIPPAWTGVWIGARPHGHLLATGRDARGRKQYIYHPAFRAIREGAKFDRLADFARLLPKIRRAAAAHMSLRGLPREKVLATIVHLLETTLIRIGNADYMRQNKSYGLTTLRTPHVRIEGAELRFEFKGKSGRIWRLSLRDRRIAKVVRACQELPGQQLFQYVDDGGEHRGVTSTDVNAYLREIAGCDVTAKDFRTWAGTVMAALALAEIGLSTGETAARRNVGAAIRRVAERLGNTPAICRKCYVHPDVLDGYLAGVLPIASSPELAGSRDGESGLAAEEAAVLAFLSRRPGRLDLPPASAAA